MEIPDLVNRYKFQIVLAGVGLILLIVGGWQSGRESEGRVVVLEESTQSTQGMQSKQGSEEEGEEVGIVVEVAGAVNSPGVYRLEDGARVAEVLALAGGLHEEADRAWVARSVNQAEKLSDGMKVYIPAVGEEDVQSIQGTQSMQSMQGTQGIQGVLGMQDSQAGVVNLNTASQSELEDLWGVGPARAQSIMEHRPYTSVDEAMQKAGIPRNVLERNEGRMGVW